MRKGFYIIGLLLLLASCTGDKEVRALLDRAEALMEAHPDSAYETLSSLPLKGGELKGSSERAFYLLLFANASYKLGKPMPSDTVFQEVVDYYDRHGNANERMLAYYLMGGIYLTRHEAPMALQWYLDATEQADTLSPDCNYWTLTKIYGQMAELYHSQLMPMEEIEANRKFSIYAEKAGNTYQAIRGIEKQLGAYQLMSDTAMILALTDSVHDLYLQADMPQAASSVFYAAIHIHLARHDYLKAKQLMDIFETQSGLFDTEGNIAKSREHYYQSKGIYYKGIGMLDSAEYYYRRLLPYGFELDGYKGLIGVFKQQGKSDSVIAATSNYELAYKDYVNNKRIEATQQTVSMYDYSRHERIAQAKGQEAKQTRYNLLIIIIGILIVTVLLSYLFYVLYTQSKLTFLNNEKQYQQEKNQLIMNNDSLLKENSSLSDDYTQLKAASEVLSHQTESQITMLNNQINQQQFEIYSYKSVIDNSVRQFSEMLPDEREQILLSGKIVMKFREFAIHTNSSSYKKITDDDWKELKDWIKTYLPNFFRFVSLLYKNNDFHLKVLLLTRLKFVNADIQRICDIDYTQQVNNIKCSINKKMFHENNAKNLYDNLRNRQPLIS